MGRRRWNKKHPDKARAQQHPQRPEDAGDPPVRLLALQPNSTVVGVAMGDRVTIIDFKTGAEVQLGSPKPLSATDTTTAAAPSARAHTSTLRVLQFSSDGRFLLTGADDKFTKLWVCDLPAADTLSNSWRCVAAWRTPKKACVGGFSLQGAYALFADKFGDVLVARVPASEAEMGWEAAVSEPSPQVPSTLLGHFCTIVTGLAPSPCGRFLATSDREYKVRVSVLPEDPLQGSYEIQGYCLGHQDFVSCLAFAVQQDGQQSKRAADEAWRSVLLSGSGDGTVRVWDYETCTQLSSYVASAPAAAAPAAAAGSSAPVEQRDAAVAATAAAAGEETAGGEEASAGGDEGDDEGDGEEESNGGEGPSGAGQAEAYGDGSGGGSFGEPQRRSKAPPCAPVLSLAVAPDGCTVAVVVEGDDEVQLLNLDWTTRSLDLRQRLRWPDVRYPCQVVFGSTDQLWVAGGVPLPTARSAHIGVAQRGSDGQFAVCTDEVLPPAMRSLLEARVEEEEAKMADGGELFVYSKRLRKPTYDDDEVLMFKRKRNDYRELQRLAALRQRQDEQGKQQEEKEGQNQHQNGETVTEAAEVAA